MFKRFDLYVIRIRADGSLANARPCDLCLKIMKYYGVRRCFYSDEHGEIQVERISEMQPKLIGRIIRDNIITDRILDTTT